jgi:outer membrane protein assembly factor BamB
MLTRGLLAITFSLLLLAPLSVCGQTPNEPIIRPATRELRQLLNRARRALDEQDYPAAVQALEELLTDSTLDDYFLAAPGQEESQVSVKAMAMQLLGGLPASAKQLYETQVGHEARRRLNEALANRDLVALSEVARRYVHTKAGYEASFLLGRVELDQGRPLAAALHLQPLCEQPGAREMLDPELSVLTAAAWNYSRRPDKAVEVLIALKLRTPRVKVRLQDGEEPLFEREEDALSWLERIAGRGLAPSVALANQWVMFRGDETRNAASEGGLPLVNAEWYFPTVNDPKMESRLSSIARSLQDKGESVIPATQALAVTPPKRKDGKQFNYVVVRTPDEVMGISLHNGRRLWGYPWDQVPVNNVAKLAQGTQQAASTRESQMRQRLWDDNLYNQMSSDGTQLYFVDDLEYMRPTSNQVRVVWNGMQLPQQNKAANHLTALNLAKQGYRVWVVGGDSGGDDPNLAGAYFLGAPISVAEKLYVIAEFNGEIRLLCLDPEKGQLQWKQQLGSVSEESWTIRYDSVRRLAAASPSFANGLLICPTSAGAVVAVDLGTRSLKWNYVYERNDLPAVRNGRIFISPASQQTVTGRWLDSTAVVAEGAVVITPVESGYLHCLDVVTGERKWDPIKRDDYLFVGCVHRGKIILVGKRNVRAINLSDGKDAWSAPIDFDGEVVSGRGFYDGTYYYLPTTGRQLLKLELDSGKVAEKSRTELNLGNLISFEGQIISAGHDQISAFYRAEHIEALVTEALQKNPNDVQALARMGEILLAKGETQESLELLRRAQQARPDDIRIRGLLARVMLVLLRTDFVNHHDLVPEARKLITDPVQRRELLRLQAVGMHKAGFVAESLDAFVTLADELQNDLGVDDTPDSQMEYIDNKWQVRTSRWLRARLTDLYTNSKEVDRTQLQQLLEERLLACLKSNSLRGLRQFVEIYGFHPLADRARLALVQKLIAENALLEAELRAGDMLESADSNYHLAGLAALVEIYDLAGRTHLAAERFTELTAEVALHPVDAEHPAASFVMKRVEQVVARRQLEFDSWPGGKVQKIDGNIQAGRARPYMNNYSVVNLAELTGPAPRGIRAMYDASQQAVYVVDSLGRTISMAPIRRSDGIYRPYVTPPYTGLTGRATGHIIVVHAGGEVLAIDALRANRGGTEPILWRGEVITIDPLLNRSYYPQSRQVTNPIIGNRMIAYDQSGQTNYQPGPVTPLGVVYQRSKQLICADPITGEILWERHGLDNACELFGDDEMVFAVPTNSDEAKVYSMRDGAELGTRRVGRSNTRLATSGRRILAWEQVGGTIRLRLFDAWGEQEDDLWKLETPLGCKGQLIDGSEFALLEKNGKFSILSLAKGMVTLTSQLEAEPELHSLYVWPSKEQYTVLANRPVPTSLPVKTHPMSAGSMGGHHAHGLIYALDRQTGKNRWSVPAFISQHGIAYDQPVDSPLLVFVCNRQGATPNQWTSTVLCLDKRTGAVAYEADIAPAQAIMCEVMADLDREAVQITIGVQPGTTRVTLLKLTSDPLAPQTPAQLGVMSSLSVGQVPGKSVDVSEAVKDPNGRQRGVPVPAPADPFGAARGGGLRLPPNLPPQIAERIKQLQQQAEREAREGNK